MLKIKRYIPNILSTLRLILAFVFPFIFFQEKFYLAIGIFIVGSLSDLFDGYLARKWDVQSDYGKRVDHIADKWFAGMAILTLAVVDNVLIFVLFILEVLISGVGVIAYTKHVFKVAVMGKIKTAFLFFTVIVGILVSIDSSFEVSFWILTGITFFFQLVTIISYFRLSFSKKNNTKTR